MLYRALLLAVFGLWATMWVLLVRSELRPDSASLRTVPVEYVLRNAFRIDKDSDLWIKNGNTRIGSLRLSPKSDESTGLRTLGFSGFVTISLPMGGSRRPGWVGELVMDSHWAVQLFRLSSVTRESYVEGVPAPSSKLELAIRPPIQRGEYRLRVGDDLVDQLDFSLDEMGISQLMSNAGIDSALLQQFPKGTMAIPAITARQSTYTIRNEKLETYLVTVVTGGQTLLEAQVSQLGEILHVKTIIGWTMEQIQ